jgi:hypothetical protein
MVNKRTNLATVLLSVSVLEVRSIGYTPSLACDNDRNPSLMYKGSFLGTNNPLLPHS